MKTRVVWAGMLLEALAVSFAALFFILFRPSFLPPALSLLLAQGTMVYAVHCLSHYVDGWLVGIRFSGLYLGRSALLRSGSRTIGLIGDKAVTPALIVDRVSLAKASPARRKAMFYAGVVASTAVPFLVALYAALVDDPPATIITGIAAAGYLAFHGVYSPRTGDIRRARLLVPYSPQDVK